METRTVKPCGMLYSQGREYFLIFPRPVEKDSWQGDNLYRWLAVPRSTFHGNFKHEGSDGTYPHARHVVTNAFIIDFTELPEIEVKVLEDVDVAELPIPENGDYEPSLRDLAWFERLLLEEVENV